MENKVINKQIPLKTIIDIANYLEEYKERYDVIFQKEEEKNKNKKFEERKYEYQYGHTSIYYNIEFYSGKNITEKDYNWFIVNLNKPQLIKNIRISVSVSYHTNENGGQQKSITTSIAFKDCALSLNYSDTLINIETMSLETEANNVYSTIMNMLEDNENRYNKTIKHRKIRIQCFTISIGIILSYLLFIILKTNNNDILQLFNGFIENKYFLIFGQWFIAILLGNITSYWYMTSLYKPLLPGTKYAGYDKTTHNSIYRDNIDDYMQHTEVHIGQYHDAGKRRLKIEKIYEITSKIVLIQILISVLLYFIIK